MTASTDPQIGDYVLATKYSDGDPGDAWALGFFDGPAPGFARGKLGAESMRWTVRNASGDSIRPGGFRRVARIREDVGRWLLEVAAPHLEKCPPGTVNLWTMLTDDAFDLELDRSKT